MHPVLYIRYHCLLVKATVIFTDTKSLLQLRQFERDIIQIMNGYECNGTDIFMR